MLQGKSVSIYTTLSAAVLGINIACVANADTVYKIKPGDTLSGISYKFNGNNELINKIAQENNIEDIDKIYAGKNIFIREKGSSLELDTSNSKSFHEDPRSKLSNVEEEEAKAWIVNRESGGDYNAVNGQYIGKYQLSSSYLNGDYSPANQDRVAEQYVTNRYGSWQSAKSHWIINGWY